MGASLAHHQLPVSAGANVGVGWIGWGPPSDGDPMTYSFGYALLPAFWNRGYMTEAVGGMLQWAFEYAQRTGVAGECSASNGASRRVMEKAGLRLVAQWVEQDDVTSEPLLHLRFAIAQQEWQAAQRPSVLQGDSHG